MVRFAIQALGAESPHHRQAKRSRSEPVVELPTSPPLPAQVQEEHEQAQEQEQEQQQQLAATFDPDTLDCQICMEPLSTPIFQCSNGHIACASCCQKLGNVCASCSKPTGKIRCLAMEKLIESLHTSCKYADHGCHRLLKFTKKRAHETSCAHTPFPCPISTCAFAAAAACFPDHFLAAHQTRTVDFRYDAWFTVALAPSDAHVVLKSDNMVFLLHCEKEALGTIVYVTFFAGVHREEFFSYHLAVKAGQTRLTMESVPRSILQEDQRGSNFVFIPRVAEGGVQAVELSFHHPGEAISGLHIDP